MRYGYGERMGRKEELKKEIEAIIVSDQWTKRKGVVVPEPHDLGLGNDATEFDGTVLYADMAVGCEARKNPAVGVVFFF